ncbi:MAG: TraR/DksA C4-type zinc finger protein [Fibrobacterales bacterium]
MEQKQREEIRATIKSELVTLERTIADLKEKTKPIAPDNAIGRVSRMDAINNKSINDAALVNAQNKYGALTHALSNIDSPDYGLCSACGHEIPAARIMHLPHTRRCMECVSK